MTYISFWTFGLCGEHRTLAAAIQHAKECEQAGGAPHKIAKIIPRTQWAKQKLRLKPPAWREL